MRKRKPGLVGGESAELILRTVREFPLSLDFAGRIVLHNTATGEAAASLQRAYERNELEVMTREEHCPFKAQHRTTDAATFSWMVITDLMIEARIAANEFGQLDALWMIKPGT